jgi:hypothetical protein
MAVVINELEVVVESHLDTNVPGPDPQTAPPPPAELDDVDDRRVLYELRVQAH